jgi:outer membrane protein OmpA-like peptidoglycan-associated protein/Tol biopolymer transport system component
MSIYKRKIIFFLLAIIISDSTIAQGNTKCSEIKNKRAAKFLTEAKNDYKAKRDYKNARELALKSVEIEPSGEGYLFIAEIARSKDDLKNAKDAYLQLIKLCPELEPDAYFQLGSYFNSLKNYPEATKYYTQYLEFPNTPPGKYEKASRDVEQAQFYDKMYANPVPFDPVSVPNISTLYDEYLPAISPDNEYIFYTYRYQKNEKGSLTSRLVEEFTMSMWENNQWTRGEKMPPPFNTTYNEGGATISVDNKELFFTICKPEGKDNYINCDIYYSYRTTKGWSEITNLGPAVNDPAAWDSQPTISSDGKTLYFASMREGGHGGIDLYKATRNEDGTWNKASNLGPSINTPGNEKSPFVHPDNKTLYFSSDGLPGLGGFDIFFAKIDEKGNFKKPVNIGYPINSESDDLGFFVSLDGKTGYFASNKLLGKGGWDIYSFPLYEGARPDRVLFIRGEIISEDKSILPATKIELKNVTTDQVTNVPVDTITGEYVSVVSFENDYIMTVKKEGFAYSSQYFAQEDSSLAKPVKADLELKKIEVGETYKLNNILFATNSYELNSASRKVIDGFVDFLQDNPTVKVEIHGHTDNIGGDEFNLSLSENRARSVYEYIVNKNISSGRLNYKGFGLNNPLSTNETEPGRALNRRTEFIIVSK